MAKASAVADVAESVGKAAAKVEKAKARPPRRARVTDVLLTNQWGDRPLPVIVTHVDAKTGNVNGRLVFDKAKGDREFIEDVPMYEGEKFLANGMPDVLHRVVVWHPDDVRVDGSPVTEEDGKPGADSGGSTR